MVGGWVGGFGGLGVEGALRGQNEFQGVLGSFGDFKRILGGFRYE